MKKLLLTSSLTTLMILATGQAPAETTQPTHPTHPTQTTPTINIPSATTENQPTTTAPDANTHYSEVFLMTQADDQLQTEEILGINVVNAADEEIGEISDLIISRDGTVAGVVISVGGFLGIGNKLVGVAWDQVSVEPGAKVAYADMSKAQLENAPAYKTLDELRAEQRAEWAREKTERITAEQQKQFSSEQAEKSRPQS